MGSVVIIVVQPVSICCGAGFVTVVGVSVGPFLGQGAVEAFDFAIGLRPVGLGKAMLDAIHSVLSHLLVRGVVWFTAHPTDAARCCFWCRHHSLDYRGHRDDSAWSAQRRSWLFFFIGNHSSHHWSTCGHSIERASNQYMDI